MNKDSREGLGVPMVVLVAVVEVIRPSDFLAFLDGGDAYYDLALGVHGNAMPKKQHVAFVVHTCQATLLSCLIILRYRP